MKGKGESRGGQGQFREKRHRYGEEQENRMRKGGVPTTKILNTRTQGQKTRDERVPTSRKRKTKWRGSRKERRGEKEARGKVVIRRDQQNGPGKRGGKSRAS